MQEVTSGHHQCKRSHQVTTMPIASECMVFHAEGLAGIRLHYAAQLTVQLVRGFENGNHHFSAAESAVSAVSECPTNVPHYHYICVAVHVRSLPNHRHLSPGDSIIVHTVVHCTAHASNVTLIGNMFAMMAFLWHYSQM